MSKTKEELNAIKEELEAMNDKLSELTEEEIDQVFGGARKEKIDEKKQKHPNISEIGKIDHSKSTLTAIITNSKRKEIMQKSLEDNKL